MNGKKNNKGDGNNLFPYLKTNLATPLTEGSLEKALAKVSKKIDLTNERLDLIQSKMISKEDFEKVISNLNKKIEKMETDFTNVKEEVVTLRNSQRTMEKEGRNVKSTLKGVIEDNNILKKKLLELENKMEDDENKKKRENLVFYGIPQEILESNEACNKKIKVLIKERFDIELQTSAIRRLGRLNNGKPAPLLVSIPNENSRSTILKHAKKLKGSNVFVSPDYSKKIREKRTILNIKRMEAQKEGKTAYILGERLHIDNEVYEVDTDLKIVKSSQRNKH